MLELNEVTRQQSWMDNWFCPISITLICLWPFGSWFSLFSLLYTFLFAASCPAGRYYSSSSLGCQDCQIGYYQPARGKFSCIACDPGLITYGTGSTLKSQCIRMYIYTSVW